MNRDFRFATAYPRRNGKFQLRTLSIDKTFLLTFRRTKHMKKVLILTAMLALLIAGSASAETITVTDGTGNTYGDCYGAAVDFDAALPAVTAPWTPALTAGQTYSLDSLSLRNSSADAGNVYLGVYTGFTGPSTVSGFLGVSTNTVDFSTVTNGAWAQFNFSGINVTADATPGSGSGVLYFIFQTGTEAVTNATVKRSMHRVDGWGDYLFINYGSETINPVNGGLINNRALEYKAQITLGIVPVAPANGATNVATDQDLSWLVKNPALTNIDLYFGTVNDPNLSVPANKKLSMAPITTTTWDTGTLENSKTYYWKIDAYEPNGVGAYFKKEGHVWSFTTAAPNAQIGAVSPAFTAASGDAVLSVTSVSVSAYQWYKIGSPDVQLTNGTDYSGVTTNTLTIKDVQLADEGNYYCIGSNSVPTSASNRDTGSGRVMQARLTSYYPFEIVDAGNITPDTVSGYNMTLTNEGASAGLPVLAADVAGATLGTYSLKFDNLDNATDPNGQYAQIAADVAKFEDITIETWVKYNGGSDWQRILDIGSSTTNYMFLTPKAGGGGLRFAILAGTGEQQVNAPALTVGAWTHVAVTIKGDTGRLYVNGTLADTNTNMTYNPISVIQTNNLVGKSQFVNDVELNGLLDELKIYNYARSTTEIAKDYLAVRGDWVCNKELPANPYDFDGNCRVGLEDFAIFAAAWLESNRITLP
jgi:hypothetical protein